MGFLRKKRSFREQLMIGITAFIVISLIFYFTLFQLVKGVIVKQYSEAARQSVDAVADNIDFTLQDIENISNSILTNRELVTLLREKKGDPGQFVNSLNSYFVSSFSIEGIYTMSEMGYLYVGANIKNGVDNIELHELKDTAGEIIWFPTALKDVSILSGTNHKRLFSMGRKVLDVNSLEELGYLKIEMDERVLEDIYQNLKEEGSTIYIFDAEENLLSCSDDSLTWGHNTRPSFVNEVIEGSSEKNIEYSESGTDYVAIYSPCNNDNWRIVKTLPKDILYADINHIQLYAVLGGIVFLVLLTCVSALYSRNLTKPIAKMIAQMKEVEEGNLSVRVHTNVNYELDTLGERFNHMIKRLEKLMDENVMAERHKNEMELEVLHAQINPHFLYNTLNTVRWMAKIKGEEKISEAIVALVKLLRVSISLGNNMITLKDEISYIENYLLIQRLRFNQLFEVEYDVLEKYEDLLIPKLILQPIVENSLIYGIDEAEEEREEILFVKIYTKETGKGLEIIVEDNGPGIDRNTLKNIFKEEKNINKFSTVGLNNVNQRLQMYFGEAYGLQIISEDGQGTKVIIEVPSDSDELRGEEHV